MKDIEIDTREPIHEWFELSRAQYLTVPRSVLQSMPVEWQERFVKCLEELDDTIDWRPQSGCYWVILKDSQGRYMHDDFHDYQKGRRHIEHKPTQPIQATQYCGNCHLFADETIDADGWCEVHQESRMCDDGCEDCLSKSDHAD